MPELPEVEVAARNLVRWAQGKLVRAVACTDRRALGGGTLAALDQLRGLRLRDVDRRGKNLLLTFGSGSRRVGVWSHLGMTGKWVRRDGTQPAPRFGRVRLDFGARLTLHFVDMRLFGFFRLVPDADFARLPVIAALGPDPLHAGIDPVLLSAGLARRRTQPVKVAIMDQRLIAGVGNIQAAESLNRAGIDPRRLASTLTAAETRGLARAVLASFHYTLGTFARAGADGGDKDVEYVEEPGTRNPFRVYGRDGQRCPRCRKGTITHITQAGRTTYFCPHCQH